MWVAWTVVGVLGFVLAFLASARCIYAAIAKRKKHKHLTQQAAPGAAVLWATPPAGPDGGKPSDAYEPPMPQPGMVPPLPAVGAYPPPAAGVGPGAGYNSTDAFYTPVRDATPAAQV